MTDTVSGQIELVMDALPSILPFIYRNGLSVASMGTVLTCCSVYSSGTAKVLPATAASERTADVPLASVISQLALASRLAMRVGAPMVIGNVVRSLLQAESNALGATAELDDADMSCTASKQPRTLRLLCVQHRDIVKMLWPARHRPEPRS